MLMKWILCSVVPISFNQFVVIIIRWYTFMYTCLVYVLCHSWFFESIKRIIFIFSVKLNRLRIRMQSSTHSRLTRTRSDTRRARSTWSPSRWRTSPRRPTTAHLNRVDAAAMPSHPHPNPVTPARANPRRQFPKNEHTPLQRSVTAPKPTETLQS